MSLPQNDTPMGVWGQLTVRANLPDASKAATAIGRYGKGAVTLPCTKREIKNMNLILLRPMI